MVIAVSGRTAAALETKLNMLAAHVGALVGGTPDWAGTLPSGVSVWNIGHGRPVFLRRLEENDRLNQWYAEMGEPVGPDREYWSVVIDWRGPAIDAATPAGTFVIPAATRVVHGAPSWPDGTISEQRERVSNAVTDDRLSRAASSLAGVYRHVAQSLSSVLPLVLVGLLGIGAIWAWQSGGHK